MSVKSFLLNPYIKTLFLVILISALLIVIVFWWLNIYTGHGKEVKVPDIKGITVAEAIPYLDSKGLRYEVIDSIYAKDKKPGVICEQIPQSESTVKINRTIYLTINAFSDKQIELPDVRDLSQRQAETILENAGFTVSVNPVESEFKDLVLRVKHRNTIVYPGAAFIEGTLLTLDVGNGALATTLDTIPPPVIEEPVISDESWF